MPRSSLAVPCALFALVACGRSTTAPEGAAATVEVSPSSGTLALVGDRLGLTATVRDAAGRLLADAPVTWTTSDGSVAVPDARGQVTARGPGSARIAARSGPAQGSAEIEVPPVPPVKDLRVVDRSEKWIDLAFTQVADGLGGAADYQVRYAADAALDDFGGGASVTAGSCAGAIPGGGVGDTLACRMGGLTGGVTYAVRVAAFRGSLGTTAVMAPPSPAASATTDCPARLLVGQGPVGLVGVGSTADVALSAVTCDGQALPTPDAAWTPSRPGVVAATGGHLTALGVGSTEVTVTAACCVAATVEVTVSPPPGATWPDEPVDFRELSSDPFTEVPPSGSCDAFGWCYTQRDPASGSRWVVDPSVPQGDGGALEIFYAAGLKDGLDPGVHWIPVDDRELFVGFTFKIDPVYQTPETGQKLGPFFLESEGSTDFFLLLKNVGGGTLQLGWNFTGGRVAGAKGALLLPDQPGTVSVQPGRWYRVEAYVRRQTADQGAVVRWWASQWTGDAWTQPLLQGSRTDVAFDGGPAARFIEFQLDGTWGGGNSDKRQDDWIRIDRVHLSHP